MGTQSGVGSTHLAIMTAVFLGMIKGCRVALAEANRSDCFRQAEIIRNNLDKYKHNKIISKISIYKQSNADEISKIVSEDFDYVVIDMGADYEVYRQLFLMCNMKLVIGSLSWWKLQGYVSFFAMTDGEASKRHWEYLGTNVTRTGKKYLQKEFGISILEVPCEPDPFRLGVKTLDFMEDLMKGR